MGFTPHVKVLGVSQGVQSFSTNCLEMQKRWTFSFGSNEFGNFPRGYENCADDPAVVFLAHDCDEFPTIAGSFSEFLAKWEALCFITLEWWTLEKARSKSAELRSLFRRV